jgi:hypothetical protein
LRRLASTLALVIVAVACAFGVNAKAAVGHANASCGPAPHVMTGKPALPPKFPTPAKVSYSSSTKVGPSVIVKGFYASGNLTAIHHAYSKALKAAGYTITHEEQDAADSEVVWKGHGKTGQVALAKRCTSRILITIPVRPAG